MLLHEHSCNACSACYASTQARDQTLIMLKHTGKSLASFLMHGRLSLAYSRGCDLPCKQPGLRAWLWQQACELSTPNFPEPGLAPVVLAVLQGTAGQTRTPAEDQYCHSDAPGQPQLGQRLLIASG